MRVRQDEKKGQGGPQDETVCPVDSLAKYSISVRPPLSLRKYRYSLSNCIKC